MKNKLHADARKFWKYRAIVLNPQTKCIKRNWCQFKMNKITRFYNAVIPNQAMIKGDPILPHGLIGIFISKSARIGENCTIFQNVTIGSNQLKGSKTEGSPVIENNVLIGANAVVIGGITIGEGSYIGAGCAVATDIPSNVTVVSAKTRIIERENVVKR